MAAARTATRGLTADDLQSIRDTLAAGRKPKVMFTESAGQVAGQVGQVVGLTDPALSEEWVVVRFGRDELPFSPADLRVPPRGAARPGPAPAGAPPPVPAPREVAAAAPPPAGGPAQEHAAGGGEPGTAARPAKRAGRPARAPKSPASLTVTLAYADGEWTVGATQGSRALAKPYVIKPAEALKMVGLLDVAGVQEAVEQIVAAERAQAEAQAERLRAELAEIESRLAALRDAG